jgi:mannose-6-phosphate isomerase-like protein (cupin superfamily)
MHKNSKRYTIRDMGDKPAIINISALAEQNDNFRTAIWSGTNMQITLMSLASGEETGVEIHPDTDQMISVVDGYAMVEMGTDQKRLNFRQRVPSGYTIIIPEATYHNVRSIGKAPLKLYTVYAPAHHPWGTVDKTRLDSVEREERE